MVANLTNYLGGTIQRAFARLKPKTPEKLNLKEVVVLADASYYGDRYSFGVVAFKDAISGKFLWWKFIYKKEQISDYLQGLEFLKQGRLRYCCSRLRRASWAKQGGIATAFSVLPIPRTKLRKNKAHKQS